MTRIVRPAITILASSVFFLGATCFLMNGASAQKQRRRPPARSRPIIHAATIDYSRFSHTTKKHQGACNSCHKIPTDKHQDVIAQLIRFVPAKQEPLFVRAAFTSSVSAADDKAKHFNNCEICHGTRATAPLAPPTGWTDAFVPDAATFKTAPGSHAACFNCHWKRS